MSISARLSDARDLWMSRYVEALALCLTFLLVRERRMFVSRRLGGLTTPAAEYKDDGDPTTLEIVFLTKKADGPSRVSDNGEVIFLYKASDETQQKLITRAFEIRIARAASGI